jgi:uncharacterized protein YjbI with pentapeptide repeats
MFDPTKPVFTGKIQLQTTNPAGQKYYLSYTSQSGTTVPTLSSTRSNDLGSLWTTYDAGAGSVVLASNTGLFLSVQAGNLLAVLLPDPRSASPVTLVPAATTGQVEIIWVEETSERTLTAYYQLGTGMPATLTFLERGGSSGLAALARTSITPGLTAIQSAKSAVCYDLTGVNLTRASLAGVDCSRARFDGAVLSGTDLSRSTLTGASFAGVDLTGVLWGKDVSAASANFTNSIGTGVVIPSSAPPGKRAVFDSATFTGADWAGCDLAGASLHNAFVAGANFCGANLESAYLYVLQGGKSNDGKTPGADFSYAYMPDVNLQSANLNGANLSDAQIYILNTGASLLNADLTEADFSGADLTGARFGGLSTSIAGTNFDRAVLFQASFDSAVLCLSSDGLPVTMVGAWLENASFNVRFAGVRMSGARVAVAAGPAVAGVPLFTITSGVQACVQALGGKQVPDAFRGPGGAFAAAGYTLASTAQVAVVSPGQCWTLTQDPTRTTPGVEEVVYSVVLTSGVLHVYATGISLVEQGDGGIAYATSYTVAATVLPPASLSPDTRCPNHLTKAANDRRGFSWEQMMTAPRLSLADLTPGGARSTPSRRRAAERPAAP